MAIIGVGLYVAGSLEAVQLYCDAFGMELGYHVLRQDGSGYFHSELYKDCQEALCVVEAEHSPGHNPVQLGFTFDNKAALGHAYQLLADGGKSRWSHRSCRGARGRPAYGIGLACGGI